MCIEISSYQNTCKIGLLRALAKVLFSQLIYSIRRIGNYSQKLGEVPVHLSWLLGRVQVSFVLTIAD